MKASDATSPQAELLIEKVRGNPVAMLTLARTLLLPSGNSARARELCEEALRLAPDDGEVRALAQTIRSRDVGSWYFTMVQDHPRHALYAEAFRKVFAPGCTVLDIGAGTGLFAMLAAREGAAKVIACERDPAVAAAAREIVALNGYSDRVTVIAKDSRDLQIGVDLDGPVDALLWDNLANDLIGVGGLDTVEDARRRLLKPGAPIIPGRCEIRVALACSDRADDMQMGVVDGFDLTPFNSLRPAQTTVNRNKFTQRSDAATIFEFNFAADEPRPGKSDAAITASGGRVDGIVQWLRFHLADDILYDTGDGEGVMAFGIEYHAIEPFEIEAGSPVTIHGAHDRHRIWFWIDG